MSDEEYGNSLTGSLIQSGASLFGNGINALLTWKGMKMQREENRRAERLNLRLREEDIAREDARYADSKRMAALARRDAKKREQYERSIGIINNMTSIMNRQPILAQNMVAMYKSRR